MPTDTCCPVLELRQYTLHPGQRDVLIELFDREFIETQEAVGMRVVGQFRDLDRPDYFVWVRGFRDLPARAEALGSFYGGPVWKRHARAANATMIDSDDVLMLRPWGDEPGFDVPVVGAEATRAPAGSTDVPQSLLTATIYALPGPVDDEFMSFFDEQAEPILAAAGAPAIARLVTEPGENTFPALPIRTGENVVIRWSRFADAQAHHEHLDRLSVSTIWTEQVLPELARRLVAPPVQLRLVPTARSLLR